MSKILIIDDSELNAKQLAKQLGAQYFDTVITHSAEEALSLISQGFFKAILLDTIMPNSNFYELCKKIKTQEPLLPIFGITPSFEQKSNIESLAAGAEELLLKPFDLEWLVIRIRTAIKVKDDLDQLISKSEPEMPGTILTQLFDTKLSNILIIDDDIAEVNYLKDFLGGVVASLTIAENIESFSSEDTAKADLIIASGYLINGYGVEICTKLKNHPLFTDKPVILIVERDDESLLKEAYKAGISEFVSSPVAGDELQIKLARLLKKLSIKKTLEGSIIKDLNLAIEDPLTGMYNRRYFDRKTESLIAEYQNTSKQLSIIMSDIDKFKLVNDTYGHLVGDQVLIETAARIKNAVASDGIVFRFGGEEFIILLENTDLKKATEIAEKIRFNIANEKFQIATEPYQINCTISLGLSSLLKNDTSTNELIKRSDEALYIAKETGRNKVVSKEN